VVGRYLNRVRHVVFEGRKSPLRARYSSRKFQAVSVKVPRQADDGRPFVVSTSGFRSNRAPRELRILPVSRIPTEVFPVRGPHTFGSSGAKFGAPRGGYAHQGQDVMASCGTRLVSIRRARVVFRDYHSAAGNYVVLQNLGTNTQFAYMHLLRPSPLRLGQTVGAGQLVGLVGQTGRAYGCHLHFEYWVGQWQTGGRPIDPLPYLYSLR
jgi:murein DD-endopeptidase MepM/ murein hydrolase activator NlpD